MIRRLQSARLASIIALLVTAGLLASGCEYFSSPANTFAPEGTVAQQQKDDFLLVMWPALAVMILVLVGMVYIAVRFRRKPGDTTMPKQVHGNTALELSWTIIPIIMLTIIAVPTVAGIQDLERAPADDALRVTVTGVQWAWLFEYPDLVDEDGNPVSTTGELTIPVDREIGVDILSADVNHSFWIPKLAGKVDAINNHPNEMWIEATRPGRYFGQCAEFCGTGHAGMEMYVTVLEQDEFDAWVAEQGATVREPELAASGE